MKVAHIVPTQWLWLTTRSGYHLVLAHKLLQDVQYRLFYQTRHEAGDYIIVDNGEVEFAYSGELAERLSFADVVRAAEMVGADEVCMPDYFMGAEETLDLQTPEVMALVAPRHRMVIPQGDNLDEWQDCCCKLASRLIPKSIGVPKHMQRFGRDKCLESIEAMGFHRTSDVHLLGVWDDPREEIVSIVRRFPWVRGIDTGVAVAYAQHDLRIQDYPGEHVGMDWDAGKLNDRLAEHNMAKLEDWANARDLARPRDSSGDDPVRGPEESDEHAPPDPASAP